MGSKLMMLTSSFSRKSKVFDLSHAYHFLQMRGPGGKGFAEMAVSRVEASAAGLYKPMERSGSGTNAGVWGAGVCVHVCVGGTGVCGGHRCVCTRVWGAQVCVYTCVWGACVYRCVGVHVCTGVWGCMCVQVCGGACVYRCVGVHVYIFVVTL